MYVEKAFRSLDEKCVCIFALSRDDASNSTTGTVLRSRSYSCNYRLSAAVLTVDDAVEIPFIETTLLKSMLVDELSCEVALILTDKWGAVLANRRANVYPWQV